MSAPDKIYLQWADEESDEDYNEITWCVDQIDDTDVEYSRVTLEELAALRRVAEAARKLDVYWSLQNPDDEFWGDQFDQDLSFAVREYDKCRAE